MKKRLLTKHAKQRMRSRGVANTKARANKMAARALANGLSYNEATGQVRSYMAWLYAHARNDKKIRTSKIVLYGEHVYIFAITSKGVARLVTTYRIPDHIYTEARRQLKLKKEGTECSTCSTEPTTLETGESFSESLDSDCSSSLEGGVEDEMVPETTM